MKGNIKAILQEKPNLQKASNRIGAYLQSNGHKDWNEIDYTHIKGYIRHALHSDAKRTQLSPSKVENFRTDLLQILELYNGKLTDVYKYTIKAHINRIARPLLERSTFTHRKAKTFKLTDVKHVIRWLWNSPKMAYNAVAVILSITFTTGARVADCLNIIRSRVSTQQTEWGRFLVVSIKTSKNNPLGKYPEQLTCKLSENMIINPETNIKAWLEIIPENDEPIFSQVKMNTKKVNYVLKRAAVALGMESISGHSGRNTVLQALYRAKVDDISKIMYMRWRYNTDMHLHYRNNTMEATEVGAAYQLHHNNYNAVI